jgi:ethanolamine utilization cobalamin adenosyltransferase
MLASEYNGTPLPAFKLMDLTADQWREASHRPEEFFGRKVHHSAPDYRQGALAVRLNTLRTRVREAEVTAAQTFIAGRSDCARPDILNALNRLSSIMYALYCREVATQ